MKEELGGKRVNKFENERDGYLGKIVGGVRKRNFLEREEGWDGLSILKKRIEKTFTKTYAIMV